MQTRIGFWISISRLSRLSRLSSLRISETHFCQDNFRAREPKMSAAAAAMKRRRLKPFTIETLYYPEIHICREEGEKKEDF